MAQHLVSDELWGLIQPLLPVHPPNPKGGHPRIPDRVCLAGIIFVLKTGLPWEEFPQEMGCCGMTLWNRLHEWHEAGVWDRLHHLLLDQLRGANRIDFSRVVGDSASVRAMHGEKTGPNPVDRRKKGSKHHLVVEAQGAPLAVILTAANVNDVTQLKPLVRAIPPIRGKPGAPLRKPKSVMADRGFDSDDNRGWLAARDIRPLIARRFTGHGSGLGAWRWVVERTLAWLHQFRHLRVRDERRDDIHEAFLSLACALICWRCLGGYI